LNLTAVSTLKILAIIIVLPTATKKNRLILMGGMTIRPTTNAEVKANMNPMMSRLQNSLMTVSFIA
jgi:hypothetical protein